MGHVVNPINFRLGTVKVWNSSIFSDFSTLKYNGYFAVVSYNIYFFLSKIFRSRFFTYVTSYIFSHIKLFWKYNKILCFVFLFNGATEIGGYKNSSLVSFFFSKQKKFFRRVIRNLVEVRNKSKISIFPNKFFLETGFSYNFFYKMWINKKLRYYGIYKPIMIDRIRIDGYKFLFKTKVTPESSTFQRFLFKHMMYKRKELRKKWNKMNHIKIKVKKQFRRFFIKKFLKYIYYISIKKPVFIETNSKMSLASFKYYKNIKLFRNFNIGYGKEKLRAFIRLNYRLKFFSKNKKIKKKKKKVKQSKKKTDNRKNEKKKKKVKKVKFRSFPYRLSKSFKARSLIFQEPIYRSRRNRLKRRAYTLDIHNKFKFLLNKFIKKLKFNIYRIFFIKLTYSFFLVNCIFNKYKKSLNNRKFKISYFFKILLIFLFKKKQNNLIIFKKGFNIINKSKFKIDLLFSRIFSYNLEIGLLKYNSWNVQNKLEKMLKFVFKGFNFKMQFHFINIKNINAKIISYYIAVRLKQKYRIGPILRDVKKYCNLAKEVRGWKLTCAGRFSKKEIASYIVQKGGSFGYSSITSLLDYSFNPVILKYSICGIKVWFVLRKNYKKIASFQYSFSKIVKKKKIKEKKETKKTFFFNEYKKELKIKNVKYKKNIYSKNFSYYIFKNFHYKRLKKNSGFWAIWRTFSKKYKFMY